jgi:hypothetical protein
MTVPNIDSTDNKLMSDLAAVDGKMREDSFESYMDVLAIFEHTKRRFKTGEPVVDGE